MKKLNRKNKKKVTRRKKYSTAGMYANNQIPAGIGSTAMTVYQEDNPEIQAKREAALTAEENEAVQKSEQMSQEIESEKAQDKDKIAAAKAEGEGTADAALSYGSQGLQMADQAGLFGDGTVDAATQAKKDKSSTIGALKSAHSIYKKARQAKNTVKGVESFNKAKSFIDSQKIARDGFQSFKMAEDMRKMKESTSAAIKGFGEAKTLTMDGLKTADEMRKMTPMGNLTLSKDILEGSSLSNKTLASGYKAASQGTQNLAKGSAIGKGLKDFATSGAGIGLIATGLGAGAKKIWGDDDDTKYNAGEVTGDILSGVGTGMSTAAALGTIVPGVGNVVGAVGGALYGLGKGLVGQKKAKKEKAKLEQERSAKITKFNKEVSGDLGAQMARSRAGEVRQKSYSGYDLGRNVTAKRGGYRGMPRYAY